MHVILSWVGAAVIVALTTTVTQAARIAELTEKKCGACHQMKGPADKTLVMRQERKAPPLFYAGNKFRQEWLESWLQHPARIRPAGDFPVATVKVGPAGDKVETEKLVKHLELSTAAAKDVSHYLMTLKFNNELIAAQDYTPGRVSERMGTMDFVKFKGCGACHKDTPKYGGISGPELYTAWQRLQPKFITSYIQDPMVWEPRSLMPNKNLNSAAIHKLADYLKVIGEKSEKMK